MMERGEERDFFLRSLDDLDAERAEGNIDDETYARLHADYTARAASALRALRDGTEAQPEATRASGARRALVIGGLVVFAAVASVVLAFGLGARLPGQTATGRAPEPSSSSAAATMRALETAVADRPSDANAHLQLARYLMGQRKLVDALKEFDRTAQLDPANAEALAYGGWIVRLAGLSDAGLARVDKAITANGDYPDAHFFRGLILLRDKADPAAAIPEFQRYLVAAPDAPLAAEVRQLLAEAVEAAKKQAPKKTAPKK